MILARVTGSLTSSDKNAELAGYKLLVVQPLGLDGEPEGDELIAADRVDAGIGEKVLIVKEGNAARQLTGRARVPLQALVVGVVDHVDWLEPSEDRGGSAVSGPEPAS
ncbi:MAG TPA: EutN/CcmL family microcompartment protein [Gemmatimonadota bacterium]|nr:EutN/CcmL family microcompartment protein [Gemmatimonadota bacterium]